MLAWRSDTRISEARNDDIDVRLARKAAVLGVVVGALHILDAGRNGNRAAEMSAGAGQAFEIGKGVEREIYFAGRAAVFVTTDAFEKISGQLAGVEKPFECEMGIDAGRDDVGGDFFTAL